MAVKEVRAMAVVSERLAEWLKALEPGGHFRISVPPRRLNSREKAVVNARLKAKGIDPSDCDVRLMKAIGGDKCSR